MLKSSEPLVIEQTEKGYRYSIEPFLLADFVTLAEGCTILDVGTGCGIIPLLLATREEINEIVAIEIQKNLHDLAIKNIVKNKMSNRIRLVHGDFVSYKSNKKVDLFDMVISNPPYRKLNSGRINPQQEKAIARHELSITLESLIAKANKFLNKGGIFALVYPPIRLNKVIEQLNIHRLFPSRLRFIHSSQETEACVFLVEAVKEYQGDLIIEPPLFIYNQDGSYSKEMKKIYASFNYSSRANHIEEK